MMKTILIIPFTRDGYIAAYRCEAEQGVLLGLWHQRELRHSIE